MSIQILIIEDEQAALEKLKRTLSKLDMATEVVGEFPSITESIKFLKVHTVDLILSDIHLNDGLSFEIFATLQINTPIIFTTAYDQYSLEAFKTNSIDYILKPVRKKDLEIALDKFLRLKNHAKTREKIDFESLINKISSSQYQFKERFLAEAPNGDWNPIRMSDIAYFFADGKYTFLVENTGKKYFYNDTITSLTSKLDPRFFFRLNRKFIVHIESIDKILKYSKSRLKIILQPPTEEDVIVSTERAPDFKKWLDH